ncbi:hypothetical protein [Cellulomonas sp. URHB0016]
MGALSSRCATALLVGFLTAAGVAACSGNSAPTSGPASSPASSPASAVTLDAETRSAVEADLAVIAKKLGLVDPPLVGVVRLVSTDEWPSTQVDCLKAEGFTDVRLTADGTGVDSSYGDDQEDDFRLATYTCDARYPLDPAQDESRMTDEQKLVAYRYLTVTLVDCLAQHGETHVGTPPSEQAFLASWNGVRWNPYMEIPEPSADLLGACPPNPPADLLWGS